MNELQELIARAIYLGLDRANRVSPDDCRLRPRAADPRDRHEATDQSWGAAVLRAGAL
jgi:hypothetical protein